MVSRVALQGLELLLNVFPDFADKFIEVLLDLGHVGDNFIKSNLLSVPVFGLVRMCRKHLKCLLDVFQV